MSNRPRPAHARALLSKGSIASLLAMAWLAPVVACGGDDGDGGKPSATIVFPRVDVWTPQSTGRVRGTAVAPPSRTIVQLLVNGDPAKTTNGYADWTVDVTLEPGPNPLTVVVTDSEGEVSTTTGVTVTSNKPMRDIVSEQVLVKDGLVYAADVSEVVTIPVDGGPRKSLVTLGTDAVHHFAIDGATLYLVSRSGTFGSVPVTGGALTPIGKVQPNQRAMAVAGGSSSCSASSARSAVPLRRRSSPTRLPEDSRISSSSRSHMIHRSTSRSPTSTSPMARSTSR